MTPSAAGIAVPVPPRSWIPPRASSVLKTAILVSIIAWWFLSNAWPGLLISFHPDDVMNLHFAFRLPVRQVVLDNLVPFTNDYRPSGQALYRTLYALAGLHPRPFRVVSYCIMALNIFMMYCFTRRLTGSAEMAFLSAFIVSFHRRTEDLYRNNGTLYDILCFLFTYSTLLFYIKRRPAKDRFSAWEMVAFYALLTLSLNAKEVAVVIPALLWCYELIYAPPDAIRSLPRWLVRGKLPVWLATVVTTGAVIGKFSGENPFRNNAGYALSFTWKQFFEATNHYLSDLYCRLPDTVPPYGVVLSFVSLWAIAAVTRQRSVLFAACIVTLAPLPVVFVPARGFFAYTVAFGGWAIFVGSLLVYTRDWLWRVVWHRAPLPQNTWEPERVFLFLIALLAMMQFQARSWSIEWGDEYKASAAIRVLTTDLRKQHPNLPRHSSVLLVDDDFDVDNYTAFFSVQLLYHDKTLAVNRTKMMNPESVTAALQAHQHIFEYRDGHYVEVKCGSVRKSAG
jgi:hypothetical protein